MSGLTLRLNEIEHKFEKFSQIRAYSLKAQWLSGLNLRLKEIEHKFEKFSQIRAYSLKAQWLSGLNLRLKDLFETYSTVRGWVDETKII
ncbi:hypothetical protein ACWOA6_02375 [Globicatella sulfidifaciens]